MSNTQQRPEPPMPAPSPGDATSGPTEPVHSEPDPVAPPTAWAGWIFFAGTMLILIGIIQAIEGLVAIFNDGYYLVTRNGLLVSVDYTTWGWIHLILGLIAAAAGFGMMAGQMWARVTGVLIASVSALVNVAFLAAYPVWATILIGFDIIVIYALTVHGREAKTALSD